MSNAQTGRCGASRGRGRRCRGAEGIPSLQGPSRTLRERHATSVLGGNPTNTATRAIAYRVVDRSGARTLALYKPVRWTRIARHQRGTRRAPKGLLSTATATARSTRPRLARSRAPEPFENRARLVEQVRSLSTSLRQRVVEFIEQRVRPRPPR